MNNRFLTQGNRMLKKEEGTVQVQPGTTLNWEEHRSSPPSPARTPSVSKRGPREQRKSVDV